MSTLRALTPVLPWTTTLLVLGICLPLTACDFGRFGQHRTGPDTNDSEEPRDEDNLIEEPDIDELDNLWAAAELECESSSDCLSHETCIDSVCQIDRCTAAEYESLAPLGDNFLFYADLEVGIIDKQDWQDDYWVDSFSPGTATLDYDTSWNIGDQPAIDIAGGDLLGAGEELYAVILEDVADLFLLTDNGPERQGLPFVPTAIAAGDVDSDSVAEVIVVGGHEFAVCDLNLSYCQPFVLQEGIEMIDVAVGDVDGDVLREAVFLYEDENAQRMLHVANFDSEQTQQELTWTVEVEDKTYRIASGDLDGSGRAQIVGLQDGGWMNLNDDELDVYELVDLADGSELQHVLHQESGFKRLVDITVGDTNADEVAELLALDSDNKLASALLEEGEFEFAWTVEFDITGDPARIAMADRDNDSPRAILSEGPQVVPGASVPVVAMLLPPYSYESSAGFSSTGYGMAETMSETYTDTISMSIGMDVGVSGNFLGLFAAKYSEKVGASASMTLGENTSRSTGNRSGMRSQPDDFGFNYGAVVVSWGCFHAYTYELSDPGHRVPGSDGELIVLTVPVDSGTAMLSTNRYNALATAVGDLPIIEAPYTIGDLYDYPSQPETIYGEEIADEDYVFPNLDWYEVSDVGYVGWFNVVGQSQSNSSTYGMDMGASAGVTVAGIAVGMSVSSGWGKGYSLTLGETALFSGGIPPLRDDPETEVDEYVENFYRVAPVTYMQDYTDSQGNTSAFYVQTYAIDID